ncbi:hypothetical protein NUM3379_25180 [Kineococcus sp. NUM-3379]
MRGRHRQVVAGAAALLAVLAAACGTPDGGAAEPTAPAGTAGVPADEHDHDHGSGPETLEEFAGAVEQGTDAYSAVHPGAAVGDGGAEPVWDDASRAGAVRVAGDLLRAFARRDLPAGEWFDGISPMLSPVAAQDHLGTDPVNVPVGAVTGEPVVTDSSSVWLARVSVPTDVGAYEVLLSRTGRGAPWFAERITPPGGTGP